MATSKKVRTEWVPDAEWIVEWLKRPEMEILRVTEVIAGSEALAVMFSLRFLAAEGFAIDKESLTHVKTERVN